MRPGVQVILALFVAAGMQACTLGGPRDEGEVRLTAAVLPPGTEAFPNWPLPPGQVERLLAREEAEPTSFRPTRGGTSGAERVELRFPGAGAQFWVKAKRMPEDLDGINNSPRKELAAYAIQRLFLDPQEYVVPTAVPRCIPVDAFRRHHPGASGTLTGIRCVLVLLSVWLQDVTLPETLYDEKRFLEDPGYAYFLSNFNLLTYLIDHRDGRAGNFLIASDDLRRQVFSVDNGISFDPDFPFYNWFVPNWNRIRVAALRRESVERLRRLEERDLDRLLVVEQLEMDEAGVLRRVEPTAPIDPEEGASFRDGVVQLGLTQDEVEDVWERIEELLEDVDDGEIRLF